MFEKSAGAVIFYKPARTAENVRSGGRGKKIEYLLLHYKAGHWEFPKGHVEKGETPEQTIRREVSEETGLKNIAFIEGFKTWIKYFHRSYQNPKEWVFKIVDFYLARAKTKKVKISWEHTGYEWLTYEEALERVTFKNAKEVLRKANDFIQKNL